MFARTGTSGSTLSAREAFPAIATIARWVLAWRERARQRRDLSRLEDRMLRDIGITRLDVLRESNKPFWLP